MNYYLASAGALAFLVGLIHSVLGESMIFHRMRSGGIIPTNGGSIIGEGHVRIIWASWHIVTIFGWLIAGTLFWLADASTQSQNPKALLFGVIVAMLVSAVFVFIATKARHPGWAGLLGVAVLTWLGKGS